MANDGKGATLLDLDGQTVETGAEWHGLEFSPATTYSVVVMTDRSSPSQLRTSWREYAGWGAVLALAALTFAGQEYVARQWRGGALGFGPVLLMQVIAWSAWGLFA